MQRIMVALAIAASAALGCASEGKPTTPTARVVVPMSYMRRFEAPREAVFRATSAAVKTLGYTVTLEVPPRLKTAPQNHRLQRVGDDLVPASHSLVLSVREAEPGRTIVVGYQRTFVGEHETTAVGRPNPPVVQQMWSRIFAEIDANLR